MSKKRGQNEGSIYRRKDGRWVASVSIEGHQVSKYFATQRECREWVLATQSQLKTGLSLEGAQTTLATFLEEWLKVINNSVRPTTAYQYGQVAHQHVIPLLGNIKLKDLRPDQIQSLYNKKLENGTSARSVRMIHSVLHRALNHALQLGMIGRNPSQMAMKPKLGKKEMKTLTDVQVRTLLLAVKGDRNEALYMLAVTTGLRQAELLGLKWSDLDWAGRRLQICRQLQRLNKKGFMFSEPKSAAGRRVVILGHSVIDCLKEHYRVQRQEILDSGESWHENDLIFPSTIGTPLDHRNLYREYKKLLVKAGLPSIRFHDLRHTAATLMLQQNIHPKVVQERLGHSDISLTLNTNSHVMPGLQEEATDKIDELMTLTDIGDQINPKNEVPVENTSPKSSQ